MPTPPSANVALLFPGLDALFNTNNLKQWLGYTFIKKKLDFASQCLSHLSGKKEDLFQFVTDHRRIHIVDFDRTLIVLTTLQVAIAERIQMDHHWDIAQGCSHGDLARNVICGVTSFEDAIDILWSFSQLRHICPEGYTANVRTSKGTPLTQEQLSWLNNEGAPISQWSDRHATIAGNKSFIEAIREKSKLYDLKIKPVLPYPVHSSAMEPMQKEMALLALKWRVSTPKKPIFSSIFLKYLESTEELFIEGLANSVMPIRWMETLSHLHNHQRVDRFINIGPANTLTGWLLDSPEYRNVKVLESWDLVS